MDDLEITQYALAAGQGDRLAAERFVAATQRQLHRLLSYLSSPADAEDLVQETYLRAFSSLPKFAARAPARIWLLTIARRVAADHLRLRKRRPQQSQLDDWVDAADRAGAHTADHQHEVLLRQVIDALQDDRRDAFVLTQVLGMPYAEAAEICGCPVGTIRSRVARAREDLVRAIGLDTTGSSHDATGSGN
ncbi:sigma-70 family RNA polymerase sigma factor [Fodinicola feengrottensis]|uniref:Sigma-70 family RNA polymerase sigma factor n=1 Tax=Fodinicola feengrottensis TaxID=435914 RepID=A0ABN2IPP2_9ACTN